MARRKMINAIRTDTIENKIAFYRAKGDYETAEAWRGVAIEVGAPIDELQVARQRQMYLRTFKSIFS